MAVTVNTRSMAVSPSLGLSKILRAAFSTLADWNDARVTRKALSQLTDRELDDIGLSRGNIDEAVARRIF